MIGNLRPNAKSSGNIFPKRFNSPNISNNIPNRGFPQNTNKIPIAVIVDACMRLSLTKNPRTLSTPTSRGIPAIIEILPRRNRVPSKNNIIPITVSKTPIPNSPAPSCF
mmetsp:Transcript_432/g.482  ORF Transcript_432/g.482 Transcript_432/m.482 type:complete len:109 (-) Transcript_432:358-684(-)